MGDLGLNLRKRVFVPKSVKSSVLKRDMHMVWKPKRKTIIDAKAKQMMITLKEPQAALFMEVLIQLRKHPALGREEFNSLVMRSLREKIGPEVKTLYGIYAADAMYKKALKFGAVVAEKV